MIHIKHTVISIALLALLSGCATQYDVNNTIQESPYGFFGGLWHGIICWISFIGHIFDNSIAIYAKNNTGGWYDFGFLLGCGGTLGGVLRWFRSSDTNND